jgi:hypothetical protein
MAIHFKASLAADLESRFTISGIAMLREKRSKDSRKEKSQNSILFKHEVTARGHVGR